MNLSASGRGLAVLFLALLPITTLTGCGSGASSTSPTTTLNGNWSLTATPTAGNTPSISLGLIGHDGHYFGTAAVIPGCLSSGSSSTSLPEPIRFSVSGYVDPADSSKMILNSLGTEQTIYLRGSIPSEGNSNWSGTYNYYDELNCSTAPAERGSFTSQVIPDLKASFSGSLTGASNSSVTTTLALEQAASTTSSAGFPLTATLKVSGNACFSTGTSVAGMGSVLAGNLATVTFTMDDGSTVQISGLVNSSQSAMSNVMLVVNSGKCALEGYTGNLQTPK